MDWDFDRFSEAVKVGVKQQQGRARQQKSLALFFNKASVGKIDKPTTLVDWHGRMLVWFFPDILCSGRTVSFSPDFAGYLGYTHALQAKFNTTVRNLKPVLVDPSTKSKSWRAQNFIPPKGENKFGVGAISITPGTFMVGHKVSSVQIKGYFWIKQLVLD